MVEERVPKLHRLRPLLTFSVRRILTLSAAVVAAVFITVIIANMGGYVDEVIRADIQFAVGMSLRGDPRVQGKSAEERVALAEEIIASAEEAAGLNQPFLLRTVRWMHRALTLDWGEARMSGVTVFGRRSSTVAAQIADRLPRTLLLFGTSNLLVFVASVWLALVLVRRQSRVADWIVVHLSPMSAAPPWVYGAVLAVIVFRIPAFRFVTAALRPWPLEFEFSHLPLLLRHMALPTVSIFLSKFLQSVFVWRSLFLLHADEDHVELARAKGLRPTSISRRYILRPALPGIVTNLALLLISLWQDVIILEHVFPVEGIGTLFTQAVRRFDTPMILALVVSFGYLLAVTVLALDLTQGALDPRIFAGGNRPVRVRVKLRRGTGRKAVRARHAARESHTLRRVASALREHPGGIAGLVILALLATTAIVAVVAIPYEQAKLLWRGDRQLTYQNPKNALPTWVDLLTRDKLARTVVLDSRRDAVERTIGSTVDGFTEVELRFPLMYTYDHPPNEIVLYCEVGNLDKTAFVTVDWQTPDGRIVPLAQRGIGQDWAYRPALDERLVRRLGPGPEEALFRIPGDVRVMQGRYQLVITAVFFGNQTNLDAELILHGEVFGFAGTDLYRRDLMVAVLWGTAVALVFGVVAAVGTTIITVALASVSAWFGGWIDGLIQRLTEMNMVLPFFPVAVMIYTLYSKSMWVILGTIVALSILGASLKTYRAILLQGKAMPYLEAAQAYGAGNLRIITRYLLPSVAPVVFPQLVALVPTFVFLEAALSMLGLTDPHLPTWGKLFASAFGDMGFSGPYHLIVIPAFLLFTIAVAGSLLARTLERALSPHLDL